MDWILNNIAIITGAALGIGVVWHYGAKFVKLLVEVKELLVIVIDSLADKKLTREEIEAIIKEAKDIPAALANLFKKE